MNEEQDLQYNDSSSENRDSLIGSFANQKRPRAYSSSSDEDDIDFNGRNERKWSTYSGAEKNDRQNFKDDEHAVTFLPKDLVEEMA